MALARGLTVPLTSRERWAAFDATSERKAGGAGRMALRHRQAHHHRLPAGPGGRTRLADHNLGAAAVADGLAHLIGQADGLLDEGFDDLALRHGLDNFAPDEYLAFAVA
jgi:hypothetical protein